jgi:hypothetical protein
MAIPWAIDGTCLISCAAVFDTLAASWSLNLATSLVKSMAWWLALGYVVDNHPHDG